MVCVLCDDDEDGKFCDLLYAMVCVLLWWIWETSDVLCEHFVMIMTLFSWWKLPCSVTKTNTLYMLPRGIELWWHVARNCDDTWWETVATCGIQWRCGARMDDDMALHTWLLPRHLPACRPKPHQPSASSTPRGIAFNDGTGHELWHKYFVTEERKFDDEKCFIIEKLKGPWCRLHGVE